MTANGLPRGDQKPSVGRRVAVVAIAMGFAVTLGGNRLRELGGALWEVRGRQMYAVGLLRTLFGLCGLFDRLQ